MWARRAGDGSRVATARRNDEIVWLLARLDARKFGLVLAKLAPPALILFGVIDAAGAAWTWSAIRSSE